MAQEKTTFNSFGNIHRQPSVVLSRNTKLEQYKFVPTIIGINMDTILRSDIDINKHSAFESTFPIQGPKPILRWHPAKASTLEETTGILDKMFPALKGLCDEDLERILERQRKRRE